MKKRTLSILSGIGDFLLLLLVVNIPLYLQTKTVPVNTYYLVFYIAWIMISIFLGKYRFEHDRVINELMSIVLNAITVWGLLSLFVISLERYNKDYSLLYSQILIVLAVEVVIRFIYYLTHHKQYSHKKIKFSSYISIKNKKWRLMLVDLLSVFIAFMIMVWIKPATIRIYIPTYYKFLIGFLIWEFLLNLITQKHQLDGKKRYRDFMVPILRVNAFKLIVLAIFELFSLSRLIVFGTIILSTFFEILFVIYIGINTKIRSNIELSEKIIGVTPLELKEARPDNIPLKKYPDLPGNITSAKMKLHQYLADCCPELFEFINKNINLDGIKLERTTILDTKTIFNVDTLTDNSHSLFINRHKVNDFKRMNEYLSILNNKIEMGGYIIGCGETIKGVHKKMMDNFPHILAEIIYFFHFLFKRVLPKLPIAKEINYLITGGQNRTLSKTEILGRVVYSGFKIIDTIEIDGIMYFIAGKVNKPREGENPSYGPFISLKRVGKNGETIKIYKFRTMHPYAEYIQDYVFENNNLEKGGKMKNDFRITGWGKLFRKLWIDELPQFINFIRGDIKLVGVRALSPHYFSLYPKEFQNYRIQFKPGILPPFYVDMPETMEEIIYSERKYLESYSKYKFLIDIKYAVIILFNITIRGKRSA
jgi:lipopolysaccharide/colanic/teichoic acid biosynthesis glycosyltransferase